MTRRLLKEEPGEVDVFAAEVDEVWEDMHQEIDTLFRHLQANQHVRGVVLLRMEGHSVTEIASHLAIDVEDVRDRLSDAGNLLIKAGIVQASVAGSHPQLPLYASGNTISPLLKGLLSPGEFRRQRQCIWRQAPPAPKRRVQLTKGPIARSPNPCDRKPQPLSAAHGRRSHGEQEERGDQRPIPQSKNEEASTPPSSTPPSRSLRPLTPLQSFGWREVYYSEVHRYGLKR